MGLGKIADSAFDFNERQFEKGARSVLGVEFPVGEDWWLQARENWAQFNYQIISGDMRKYVMDINRLVERAITSGQSVRELSKEIQALDSKITKGRANFIARDQIGRLNGQITQMRMESVGLTMYVWETAGDERVRGNPNGKYPNARPSHYEMDNLLCLWSDSSVYSEDGGKTWIDRPAGAVMLHPGDDYQCRCTATAYCENKHNIPNTSNQGLSIMPPRLSNLNTMQKQLSENIHKNEVAAKQAFPHEKWVNASFLDLGEETDFEIPKNTDNIKVAQSRVSPTRNHRSISANDAKTLAKEIRQADILASRGASVFILPKMKTADGTEIPGPDALVNGNLFEFKTVTGSIKRVETRFRESRDQGRNVYIRIINPNITRNDVIQKIYNVVNSSKYTGGFKGNFIFSIKHSSSEKLYYIKISDLKK